MVATLALIRSGEIEDAHRIAKKLLTNDHDLIHKAVGWMLRESGKISEHQLVEFLRRNYCGFRARRCATPLSAFPPPGGNGCSRANFAEREHPLGPLLIANTPGTDPFTPTRRGASVGSMDDALRSGVDTVGAHRADRRVERGGAKINLLL